MADLDDFTDHARAAARRSGRDVEVGRLEGLLETGRARMAERR